MANATEPVGVPDAEVTVARNATGCPVTDGFCEELTAVVVLAPLTVCVSVALVLAMNLSLPGA